LYFHCQQIGANKERQFIKSSGVDINLVDNDDRSFVFKIAQFFLDKDKDKWFYGAL